MNQDQVYAFYAQTALPNQSPPYPPSNLGGTHVQYPLEPAAAPTATSKQILASTPAKRVLPEELYEAAHCAPKRKFKKDERLQHEAWAVQRLVEEFQYCIKHDIRPQQLRSFTSPIIRLTSNNPWNDFVKSRYFESLANGKGEDVPKDLVLRQKIARKHWHEICSDDARKAECLAAIALEHAEINRAAPGQSIPHVRCRESNVEMIRKARMRLQATLTALVRKPRSRLDRLGEKAAFSP
ncbi:BQ2448_3781 [Microbotryum intermedium]|uniref:BQ2448_3781 protein n=1 Tax=Microbotryum intermedium TaxID=269621 RepID=A0A238FE01_9BASI|nr:BQ2448_3781 [Microbotryum intermedium]